MFSYVLTVRENLQAAASSGMNDPRFFPDLAAKLRLRLNVPMAPQSPPVPSAATTQAAPIAGVVIAHAGREARL